MLHVQYAHNLRRRDEQNVQHEEAKRPNLLLNELPSVVFAADLVSAFPPVVVRQTYRPYYAECQHMINSFRRQPVQPSPEGIVEVEYGWEYAPNSIDLAVIFVDLRGNQEDGRESDAHGKSEDGGIG